MLAIARTANISVEWLATGQPGTAPHDSPQALAEKYIQKDPLAFETDWLRKEFPDSFEHLMLTQVVDDGMEPTLPVGALVLVDTTDRDLEAVTHGIYLLKLDDRILVKRLQYIADRTIRVLSDSAAYEAFSITLSSKPRELNLMGRVVWVGRHL